MKKEIVIRKNIGIPVSPTNGKYVISEEYLNLIKNAGYRPHPLFQHINYNYNKLYLDGLLLPGGPDIDASFYGYNNYMYWNCDKKRDSFERKLLRYFLTNNKPIFSICKGFQLILMEILKTVPELNKIIKYKQDIIGHAAWRAGSIDRFLSKFFSKDLENHPCFQLQENGEFKEITVNTSHHQALLIKLEDGKLIQPMPEKFVIDYYTDYHAPKDYAIIEGFTFSVAKIKGVEFHPERDGKRGIEIFKNFFDNYLK